MVPNFIVKRLGVDFHSDANAAAPALTLPTSAVSESNVESGIHSRTHDSGWTIKGEVEEDHHTWVTEFQAEHPEYGKVWGNFEDKVYAVSEKAFQHFFKHHAPEAWDSWDI